MPKKGHCKARLTGVVRVAPIRYCSNDRGVGSTLGLKLNAHKTRCSANTLQWYCGDLTACPKFKQCLIWGHLTLTWLSLQSSTERIFFFLMKVQSLRPLGEASTAAGNTEMWMSEQVYATFLPTGFLSAGCSSCLNTLYLSPMSAPEQIKEKILLKIKCTEQEMHLM